jgi:adenosine kinase
MSVYVSGSLAFDRIMDFPGKFSDHILPEKIHILNVCFAINGLRENFGGTAGNISYTLSLLGEEAVVVATAGRDFSGYREWLRKNGIDDRRIEIVEEELTAGAYITTDQSDNQITAFNPGAMGHPTSFDAGSVPPESAYAIVAPGNLDDMHRFAVAYGSRGVPCIFDPGQSIPGWTGDRMKEAVEAAGILISNDYELEMIKEKTALDRDGLLALAGTIITTRGEEGSEILRTGDGSTKITRVAPAPVGTVLDPTGAGDAFRAGLIKGLRQGADLEHAARMGSVSAAYAVEHYGTQTFSFTAEEYAERFRGVFGSDPF